MPLLRESSLQLKPGKKWKGNKGGRPKIAREETAAWLEERDENGKTNARKIVEALGNIAIGGGPNSVSAFREIRQTVEQNQSDGPP